MNNLKEENENTRDLDREKKLANFALLPPKEPKWPIKQYKRSIYMDNSIMPTRKYKPVHLVDGQCDIAHLNGKDVLIRDEYLNSDEAHAMLDKLLCDIHRGNLGFLDIVKSLEEIKEAKLYLCIADEDGNPVYKTMEEFLLGFMAMTRSDLSRMIKARDGYLWLHQTFAGNDEVLSLMPASLRFYYTLGRIPDEDRQNALKTILNARNGVPLTANDLIEWQQNSKAIAIDTAVKDNVIEVSQPEISNIQAEPDANAIASTSDANQEDVIQTDNLEVSKTGTNEIANTVETDSGGDQKPAEAYCSDVQTNSAFRWVTMEGHDYSFEDFKETLCAILQTGEFQQRVAEDAISHSMLKDLKPGEKTVRAEINDAIAAYNEGVNQIQKNSMLNYKEVENEQ